MSKPLPARAVVVIGRIVLLAVLAIVPIEGAFRAANLLGRASAARKIDPECESHDRIELRVGEAFTGRYVFDRTLRRRWVPGLRAAEPSLDDPDATIVYHANAHGWRDRERTLEKPDGTLRLALIGDSFAVPVGRPVEEGVAWLLEQALAERLARPVEVLNFGLPGNSPIDYAAIVRHELPRYSIDLALVMLYPGNDLDPRLIERTHVVNDEVVHTDAFMADNERWYTASVSTPAVLGDLTWDELEAARAENRVVPSRVAADGTASYVVELDRARVSAKGRTFGCFCQRHFAAYRWTRATLESRRSGRDRFLSAFESPPSPVMEKSWALFERILDQMRSDLDEHGISMVVEIIPVATQVYPAFYQRWLDDLGYDGDGHDPLFPDERILEACRERSITCWVALPDFLANTDRPLFDTHDAEAGIGWGHYSAFGYRLVAEGIARQLIAGDLLPAAR